MLNFKYWAKSLFPALIISSVALSSTKHICRLREETPEEVDKEMKTLANSTKQNSKSVTKITINGGGGGCKAKRHASFAAPR